MSVPFNFSEVVSLQIGESLFQVSRATFNQLKPAVFTVIEGDTYYVDRDGDMFKYILKYIRSKTISFPNDFDDGELLMKEAEFYGLRDLKKHLQNGAGKREIVTLNITIPPDKSLLQEKLVLTYF
ncbi:Potassium channel tetramerization domain [Apostichopus japonicus]|uniref:Potassium channel tetramerization domain n=1 Tax=Stichopus japonicus TaxID=307972 RepID=A0A2G8KF51_STIJA|nr:Potassium channel tetramerization domain [Apostichopus japonicus]